MHGNGMLECDPEVFPALIRLFEGHLRLHMTGATTLNENNATHEFFTTSSACLRNRATVVHGPIGLSSLDFCYTEDNFSSMICETNNSRK